MLDQILDLLNVQRTVHRGAAVFHALGDAADLHGTQTVIRGDDVVGLRHGGNDLHNIKRHLRAVSLDDLHGGLLLSFLLFHSIFRVLSACRMTDILHQN